jgi:hypothetical protein
MLSLTRPGGWAFGEILTSAQVEALDASQAKAIDGTGGGTYTPSVKIIINGQGLQVNTLTVTGTLSLLGNTTVGNASTDAFSVLATSTFSAPVTLNDALVANEVADFYNGVIVHSGGELLASGDAVFGDGPSRAFTVNGTGTFNAPINANDTVDFQADATFHTSSFVLIGGSAQLGNDSSKTLTIGAALANALSFTGEGRVPGTWGGQLPGSNFTVSAYDGQLFQTYNGTLSSAITYTLSASGAKAGDVMVFFTGGSVPNYPSQNITLKSNIGGQNVTFLHGQPLQFAWYAFDGSGWWLVYATQY